MIVGVVLFTILTAAFAQAGVGNGDVTVTVAPNYGPARTGTVTIAGQTYTVTQASGCRWQIAGSTTVFPFLGGTGGITVSSSDPACAWMAISNIGWIAVARVSPSTVSFTVSKNNGKPSRSGTMTIAGQTFTVNQAGRK